MVLQTCRFDLTENTGHRRGAKYRVGCKSHIQVRRLDFRTITIRASYLFAPLGQTLDEFRISDITNSVVVTLHTYVVHMQHGVQRGGEVRNGAWGATEL
jgi:hypothetical protein